MEKLCDCVLARLQCFECNLAVTTDVHQAPPDARRLLPVVLVSSDQGVLQTHVLNLARAHFITQAHFITLCLILHMYMHCVHLSGGHVLHA